MSSPCLLCRPATTIPSVLEDLPVIWKDLRDTQSGEFWPFYLCQGSRRSITPLGLPHHQTLEALVESAKVCTLCGIIEKNIGSFIEHFRSIEGNREFKFYNRGISIHGVPKLWNLWLARRPDGGQGAIVLVQSPSQRVTYVICAIGLCCEPEGPATPFLRGVKINPDPKEERSFRLPAKWLQHCEAKHTNCAPPKGALPSRVLDLQAFENPSRIRLFESNDNNEQNSTYAALSHCWGKVSLEYGKTTESSLEDHLSSITVATLPQTFQDAVWVTRQLGIGFLWIDSLCICQDNKDEWARESGAMANIYSRARIVIAADRARDSTEGFLTRTAREHVPTTINVNKHGLDLEKPHTGPNNTPTAIKEESIPAYAFDLSKNLATMRRAWFEFDPEPLHQRAWALQERLLPYRILHFTHEQMFFECNTCLVSEDGFESPGRWNALYSGPKHTYEEIARHSMVSELHTLWYLILENFTCRDLTHDSDKLPSIAGLAQLFEQRLNLQTGNNSNHVDYIAGLWSDSLIEGLGWSCLDGQGDTPIPPRLPLPLDEDYIAPSWSWASKPGVSAHGMTMLGWRDVSVALDWKVTPKNQYNPYGELIDAWIKVRGPLIPLKLSEEPEENEKDNLPEGFTQNIRFSTPRGTPRGHYASLNRTLGQTPELIEWIKRLKLYALVLSRKSPSKHSSEATYISMIIGEVPSRSGEEFAGLKTYQRIGHMLLDSDFIGGDTDIVQDLDQFVDVILI